jgi:hypothetical protein
MKRIHIIGLTLAAVLALNAAMVSAASASVPEFVPSKFTFKSEGGAATFKTAGLTVVCKASTDEGEVTGAKTGTVTVKFTGCKAAETHACHSTSPVGGTEEIVTKLLSMKLGFIKEPATTEVGVSLSASPLAEFECAIGTGEKAIVKGSVIGKITPLETKTKTFKLAFVVKEGAQFPTKFEGGSEDTLFARLNGETLENPATEETEDTLLCAEETKIKV